MSELFLNPWFRILLFSFGGGLVLAVAMILVYRFTHKPSLSYGIGITPILIGLLMMLASRFVDATSFLDLALLVSGMLFTGIGICTWGFYLLWRHFFKIKKNKTK
ncbi:MAG: hypothetical protein ACRCZJ_00395 [Erysipelotrichaceae bacterium]